ncbi:MAG: hypothetical protein ABR497_08890, partial [Kiritimatiellia bacterium]|nr:hypothetical protein [Lentisphaerota bacterium]
MNWIKYLVLMALPAGILIPTSGKGINSTPPLNQTTLPFIANQGQIDNAQVMFHTRTFSGAAFVTRDGSVVYSIKPGYGASSGKMLILRETLVDAQSTIPVGAEPTEAKINFLLGRQSTWREDVPSFRAVEMPRVYRGIDLRLRAAERNMEKIFTVAPGADPALIRLRMEGADTLAVNESGELEADTELGLVRFTRPVAWQELA